MYLRQAGEQIGSAGAGAQPRCCLGHGRRISRGGRGDVVIARLGLDAVIAIQVGPVTLRPRPKRFRPSFPCTAPASISVTVANRAARWVSEQVTRPVTVAI